MLQKLLENHLRPRFRVSHRRHGFVFQRQLLPAAGEIPVNGRGRLTQPLDKVRPVMDQQRSRLGHAHGKLVQRVQQGGLFLAVPQNTGLVLVEPLIFRKCLRVPGPQLADAVIQKSPPGGGSFPDQIKVLWAKQHALKNAGQLSAVFQLDAVGPQHPPRPSVQLCL